MKKTVIAEMWYLSRRSFFLVLFALLISCAKSWGDYEVVNENIPAGISPWWHFLDSSASGASWNVLQDSGLDTVVMSNCVPTTQAVRQFDPKTLVNTGDFIHYVTYIRTPASQSTGTFSFSLLNSPSVLTGNSFGYSTYPLTNANGYCYSQNYSSNTPTFLSVTNNVGTSVGTTSSGGVLGNSQVYYFSITMTKVATGIQVEATMGGYNGHQTVVNFTDTNPPTYTFNTLRIDGGGEPVYITSLGVDTSIPSTTYSFTMPHAYITSAAIFNSSNQMVRQLWKKYSLAAGSYTESWDNKDDNGNVVPAGNYFIKVLYHNMSYTWEGVIGDTSSSFTGNNNTYQSYEALSYMSIDPSGDIYGSVGYNEGGTSIYTSSTSAPNSPTGAVTPDQAAPFSYVATDGINYYMADEGCSYDTNNNTFVTARSVAPGKMGNTFTFAYGIDVKTSSDESKTNPHPVDYPSCIDDANEPDSSTSTQPADAFPSGTGTITMASSAGLAVGAGVTGAGIATSTTIKGITGTAITLSADTTAAESAENLTINIPQTFDDNFVREHVASGLAVETSGSYLAVSHAGLGTVEIFNKTSGQLLQTITISSAGSVSGTTGVFTNNAAAPEAVAFAPHTGTSTDGDLWILTGTTAVRYSTANGSANYQPSGTVITGLSAPLAIAVSPVSGTDLVAIADGGASQQVKFYNHTGTFSTSIGQLGGYPVVGPDVSTGKFWFWDMRNNVPLTFLAFQSDGSLWVGDLGNFRSLHFQAPSFTTYLGQIAWIPAFYQMSADPNNPTHIYTGNLEYQVDYTQTLTPGDPDTQFGGNGSWKLIKNWFGGYANWSYGNLQNITTLSNGRTYAVTHYIKSGAWYYSIFELPSTANTPARMAATTAANLNGNNIEPDGTIRSASPDTAHAAGSSTYTQTISEQKLTGFTAANDPTWGAPAAVATMQCQESNTTLYTCAYAQYDPAVGSGRMPAKIPKTTSNYYVTDNPGGSSYVSNGTTYWSSPNNHLGAVIPGATGFLWENSAGAIIDVPDGLGTFEDTSSGEEQSYGGHDGIGVFANGHNIIQGYDGQYGYYSNQWMHYYDDGLFVGQFGTTIDDYWAKPYRIDTTPFGGEAAPGLAGNIQAAGMVNNAGTNYIYCTDEAFHAGIHRWRLDGTINEIQAEANSGSNAWYDLSTAVAWPTTNLVLNPGFECEAATYALSFGLGYTATPVGWQVDNGSDGSGAGAFYTEWTEVGGYGETTTFAHSLPYRATFAKSTPFKVRPYQIFTGIPNGTYTLSAWVRSSGGQSVAQMYWKQTPLSTTYSGTASIPTTSAWTQITIPGIAITGGQAEIGFNVQGTGAAGQYVDLDDVSFSQ